MYYYLIRRRLTRAGEKYAELSSLKNLTRKLINEVERIPGWWVGDSNRTVCKQLNELVEDLNKTCELVSGMNDDLIAVSDAKKENERLLKNDLSQYPSMLAGDAAGGGGSAATSPATNTQKKKEDYYTAAFAEQLLEQEQKRKQNPEYYYTAPFTDQLREQERNSPEKYYTAAFNDWVREQQKNHWKRPDDYYYTMAFRELLLEQEKIEWEVITPITEYYSELAAIDTLDKLKTSGDLTQEQYDSLKDFYERTRECPIFRRISFS